MSTKHDSAVELYLSNPLFTHPELMMLAEARNLIKDPQNWVAGTTHKLKFSPEGEELNVFCIQGALEEVQGQTGYLNDDSDALLHNVLGSQYTIQDRARAERLLSIACSEMGIRYQQVNDSRGHQAALDLITTAIALGLKEYEAK